MMFVDTLYAPDTVVFEFQTTSKKPWNHNFLLK